MPPESDNYDVSRKPTSRSFHPLLSALGAARALKRSGGKLDRMMVGRRDRT
jgi:hypothetical protein